MFPSFQLPPVLRRRTRSLSSPCTGDSSKAKPPKTPLGSPKEKKNRRSHLFKRGNSDLGTTPCITSLRPGSVAFTSDQLSPGDRIHSVNGIKTARMKAADVNTLLDNVDGNTVLEVSWSLPKYSSQNSLNVLTKIADITVEKTDGSIGITLRGGAVKGHPNLSRPLIITHVRPNGPAARTGLIRVGDRILKVDNHPLANKTLQEAQHLLRESSSKSPRGISLTTLTIEYEVGDMEAVKNSSGGPLLVEIERNNEEDFGVVISNCCDLDFVDDSAILKGGFYVRHIVVASLADRCGALNIGDQILTIDDIIMDDYSGGTGDAEVLLRKAKRLQILPYHAVQRYSRNYGFNHFSSNPSLSGYSTITSRHSRRRKLSSRQSILHKSIDVDFGSNSYGFTNIGICHPENLTVVLVNEKGIGYGIGASISDHSDSKQGNIIISRIIPDSPAYRCGCLHVGDRIISLNHKDNLTLQEIISILENDQILNQITLEVEFDVADTIVPSSGIFTVKLAKRGPDLGITITASKVAPDDPFLISEIRRGSIAHRTGTLHAGDRLIAIDNRNLTHHSIETAFEILQNSPNDIVTLKIEKTETENSNLFLDSVVYTVELHRYGGPLGITISGSEDSSTPIVLSRITEGGLADKTGALHVGDRILAINKESLEHRRLSDAIRLLKNSGDRVQLKIARNMKSIEPKSNMRNDSIRESQEESMLNKNMDERGDYSSPDGVMSIDSAIHSWDSHNLDSNEPDESESILSETISLPYQEKESSNRAKHDSQLQFYSDTDEIFCPSPLPLPNYTFTNTLKYDNRNYQQNGNYSYGDDFLSGYDIFHVTLYKDSIYDDYGFSVSDGLYEKGVYVNKIRKDGPADIVGLLKPYDRIIQVNETRTQDFDCCLTVPLIASAGDRIELVLARNPYVNYYDKDITDGTLKKNVPNQAIITKML